MIARDKLQHIGLGIIAIVCAFGALMVNSMFGLGACLAYTTTVVGALYEVQQHYRREGVADLLDALATAAPGWVVWALLEFL